MSDDQIPLGGIQLSFPDGTSKVFKGSHDEIRAQAKTYWQLRQSGGRGVGSLPGFAAPGTARQQSAAVSPAPRSAATAKAASSSESPDVERENAFRRKFFNGGFILSAPEQAAKALALNSKDPSWTARLKQMDPYSQQMILKHAEEVRQSDIANSKAPGSDPNAPITAELHDILQYLTMGPEGAKQLQTQKGFAPELERFGTGLLDTDSLAAMTAGGVIGATGPLGRAAVTFGFGGLMGKSAYDKMQQNDFGGAAADLLLAGTAIGAHALAEKMAAKPRVGTPEPPRPTTAQVHEPSGLGAGPQPPPPEPPRTEPPRTPPPGPEPPPRTPPQEPPRSSARTEEQQRRQRESRDAGSGQGTGRQGSQRARDARARAEERERTGQQSRAGTGQQRTRPSSQPPPQPEPDTPYMPVDPGTPHPEVDRFNEHAKTYAPRLGETADVVLAKQRLAELVGKNKLTVGEKAERVRLDNLINTHITSLQEFAKRFKEVTGRDPGLKIGTWSDATKPSGRTEVLDKVRQVLRAGATTFDKMFPQPFDTSAIMPEQPSADVSRETPKRFSALENEDAKTTPDAIASSEQQAGAPAPEENTPGSTAGEFPGGSSGSGDEGVSSSPKLSSSEHKGIIQQLNVPEPKAIYRSASNNVYLNPSATRIIQRIVQHGDFGAITVSPKFGQSEKLAVLLERDAEATKNPARKELAAVVRQAAAGTPGGSVVFQSYYPPGKKAPYKRFTLHEGTHVAQNAIQGSMSSLDRGVGAALLNPDQEQHLSSLPGFEPARSKLTEYGYNAGQIHRELPAYIASGDHARLGMTDTEAEDFIRHYLRHVLTNYGKDAVATLTARSTGAARDVGRMTGGTPIGKTVKAPAEPSSGKKFQTDAAMRPLPPPSGSGPVGRVAHHGPDTLNAMNKADAATVTGPVRAEMMTRDTYDGLNEGEQGLLGEFLVGRRLLGDSQNAGIPQEQRDAAAAHWQTPTQAELDHIASNPRIKDAIAKWDDTHRPVLDRISRAAGVSAEAIAAHSDYYFPLKSPDFIHSSEGVAGASPQGGYASWESKARPQSTGRRKQAKYSATDYSTDVGAVLRTVLRQDEPKAAMNDLWRTLDSEGLIAFQPSGEAGTGWTKPEGYVGDEIQGKFSSMPADLMALYGSRGKVYLPQDVVQTMDEITAPKAFSGDRNLEIAQRIARALISVTLGLNIPAVPFHIYRQTAMFRASTALADAKRNPATILANSIPVVGTLVKGAVIASRNADDPIYRAVYEHLVEINAISPRSMEGLTLDLGRLPLKERVNAYLHDSMFGVPHGRGVNGWAGRIAVEAYLARTRFEQTDSPERDREYIAQFGAYMRRISPFFGFFADFNPFIRTHGPRITTSLKLATGETGLKTREVPGESQATFKIREAGNRIGAFALGIALPIAGLIVLNKLLSGKYPWENGNGHELDVSLGHGNFIPIGRLATELQPMIEMSGAASRMHRGKQQIVSSMPSGMPKAGGSKMSAPQSSNPALETLGDATIGTSNTVIGMGDSPLLNSAAALLNRRMYVTYDKQKKSPDLMQLSPSTATDAQRAVNTLTAITGTSTIVPTQGYRDDGQVNIGRSIMDYLTQGAVKKDYPHRGKGMKPAKVGGRR